MRREQRDISSNDVYLNGLVMVAAVLVILLQLISPPKKEEDSKSPGTVSVTIAWPSGPQDVDLWVLGPRDKRPVGFTHPTDLDWSLLRDDLGVSGDPTPINVENAYSRTASPGLYIVNVMCYNCKTVPVDVWVEVHRTDGNGGAILIVKRKIALYRQGQEVTVVQFELDADGKPIMGSFNEVYEPLARRGR